jgi:hypothetical protein
MELTPQQILHKRQIGVSSGRPVFALETRGGYHLIMTLNKNKPETLGYGSHIAIARHIASTKANIEWNELSKSESWELDSFKELLPKYTAITDELRKMEVE